MRKVVSPLRLLFRPDELSSLGALRMRSARTRPSLPCVWCNTEGHKRSRGEKKKPRQHTTLTGWRAASRRPGHPSNCLAAAPQGSQYRHWLAGPGLAERRPGPGKLIQAALGLRGGLDELASEHHASTPSLARGDGRTINSIAWHKLHSCMHTCGHHRSGCARRSRRRQRRRLLRRRRRVVPTSFLQA